MRKTEEVASPVCGPGRRRGGFGAGGLTLACALLALGALAAACGRKADPLGVDQVRPRTISSLSGEPTPQGMRIHWKRTSSYANGKRMDDLGGFLVFRGLPGRQAEQIADIQVADRDRFRPEKEFEYVDRAATRGGTYYYRVISYTTDKYYSLPSNQITLSIEP
jgi:hypothetical protein